MAIGPGNKVTTTGMMDVRPETPQAPNLSALGKGKGQPQPSPQKVPVKPTAEPGSLREQFPDASETEIELAERYKTLTDEDKTTLEQILSPSVVTALGKMLPEFKPVMEQIGSQEPNIILPVSTVATYAKLSYGLDNDEEAIQTFITDVGSKMQQVAQSEQPMEQQPVPPSQPQGIMASPQNMEQV